MMKKGRKNRLTEEMINLLSDAISDGVTDISACGLCGIDTSTFYRWLKEKNKVSFITILQTIKSKRREGKNMGKTYLG